MRIVDVQPAPKTVWALPAPCLFGGQVVTERLEKMLAHADGVRRGEDPEAIHQMRVWSRRTRAALDLFEPCFEPKTFQRVEREVRTVTRALGQARDLDVMMEALHKRSKAMPEPERAGVEVYIAHLREERASAQDAVTRVVRQLEGHDLPRRVAAMLALPRTEHTRRNRHSRKTKPPRVASLLAFGTARIAARMDALQEYAPYLQKPEAVYELHAMRIAAKRLRYTLEIFEPVYRAHTDEGERMQKLLAGVRSLQEHLGQIHDADVLIPQLTGYLARMLRGGYGTNSKGEPIVGVHRVNFAGCAGLLTLCRGLQAERDTHFRALGQTWNQFVADRQVNQKAEGKGTPSLLSAEETS